MAQRMAQRREVIGSLKSSLMGDPQVLEAKAREATWGTFGPNADQPMAERTLWDLDTDHLENILITERHIPLAYSIIILSILKLRYKAEQS